MTVFAHEMSRGKKSLLAWSLSVGLMVLLMVVLYPEIKSSLESMNALMSTLGMFSKAFNLDMIDMGTMLGYYGIECGNVLGFGGPLFAALLGMAAVAKEEGGHTAEFLFSHPVKRTHVLLEKALNLVAQILILNVACFALALLGVAMIGESVAFHDFAMLHIGYTLVALQVGLYCFGISCFLKRTSFGAGVGLVLGFYVLNLVINLVREAKPLKYLTPYAYAEPSLVLTRPQPDWMLVVIGMALALAVASSGVVYYRRKDLAA